MDLDGKNGHKRFGLIAGAEMIRTEEQKKYHRETMSRYYAANPEKFKRRALGWAKKNADKRLAITNRWRNLNRLAVHAHDAVAAAIKNGKLKRPSNCQQCGIVCRPEAHHHNGYEKEFQLDVIWLCSQCHEDAD